MAIHNTLSLLLFISYVSISFHLATSHSSPGPTAAQSSSISDPPSISPNAGGPSGSNDPSNSDITNPGGASPGLKSICDSTDYPSLCIATVTSHHFNGDPDIPSVLELTVKAGLDLAKQGMTVAKEAAEKPENAGKAPGLRQCVDFYSDVVDNYEKALSAFPDQDMGTMRIMLSAALTNIGDCVDAVKGPSSPLAALDDKLSSITDNCLAIATLLR